MQNLCEEITKLTRDSKKAKEFFMEHLAFTTSPSGLKEMLAEHLNDIKIFDVREYENYLDGHIPYAVHIPITEINEHIEQFDKEKLNIFYGHNPVCERGIKAALVLAEKKYPVKVLSGGFKGWMKNGYEIIKNEE